MYIQISIMKKDLLIGALTPMSKLRKEYFMNIPILMDSSRDQIVKQFESLTCSKDEAQKAADEVQLAVQNSINFEKIRAAGRANFIKEAQSFFKAYRSPLYK